MEGSEQGQPFLWRRRPFLYRLAFGLPTDRRLEHIDSRVSWRLLGRGRIAKVLVVALREDKSCARRTF